MMRLLAHRMTEELLVQLDDVGILVRLADLLAGILAVDGVHACLNDTAVSMVEGLTGTSDTAARAGHNLYRVEIVHAGAHAVEQFAGIAESMGDTDVDGRTVEIYRSMTDAVKPSEFLEIDTVQLLASRRR